MTPTEEQRLTDHERTYWWHIAKRRYLGTIVRRFGILSPGRPSWALDIGAGGCVGGEVFTPETRLVFAETALHPAFRNAAVPFRVVCLAEQLSFRSGVFDLVVAADVLEHIEEHAAAACEIARALRPGGQLLVTVPAHPTLFSSHDQALGHFRRYTWRGLRELMAGAGFRSAFSSALFAALLPAAILRRLLSPPGSAQPVSSYVEVPRWLNRLCIAWFGLEAFLMRFVRLPFGSSLCTLERNAGGAP